MTRPFMLIFKVVSVLRCRVWHTGTKYASFIRRPGHTMIIRRVRIRKWWPPFFHLGDACPENEKGAFFLSCVSGETQKEDENEKRFLGEKQTLFATDSLGERTHTSRWEYQNGGMFSISRNLVSF